MSTRTLVEEWLWPGGTFWWRGAWCSVALPLGFTLSRGRRICAHALQAVPTQDPLFAQGASPVSSVLFFALVMSCALISALSGAWVVTQDSVSLHLMPAGFTVVALLLYWGVSLSAGFAYALTFLSLLLADAVRALLQFGSEGPQWWLGLGAAGLADGLFFFPMVSALLVGYVRLRAKSGSL